MYGAHTEILVLSRRRSRRVEGRLVRAKRAPSGTSSSAPSALLRTRVECASHTPSDISSPRAWRRLSAFAHVGQKPAHALGVALREFAQPPADRLLDEPFAILGQSSGPAEHPLGIAPALGPGRVKTSAARRVHKCRLSIQVSTWSSRRVSWSKQRAAASARLSATAQPSRSGKRPVTKRQTSASGSIDLRARSARDDLEVPYRLAPQAPAKVERLLLGKAAKRLPDRGVHARQGRAPMLPPRLLVGLLPFPRSGEPSGRRACMSRACAVSTIASGMISPYPRPACGRAPRDDGGFVIARTPSEARGTKRSRGS